MDETKVFRKTRLGTAELAASRGILPPHARRVLILLDGQRTLGELAELLAGHDVSQAVAQLQQRGFAREVAPGSLQHTTIAAATVAPHSAPALAAAVEAGPALAEVDVLWNTTATQWNTGSLAAATAQTETASRNDAGVSSPRTGSLLTLLLLGAATGGAWWFFETQHRPAASIPAHTDPGTERTVSGKSASAGLVRDPAQAATAPASDDLTAGKPTAGSPFASDPAPAPVAPAPIAERAVPDAALTGVPAVEAEPARPAATRAVKAAPPAVKNTMPAAAATTPAAAAAVPVAALAAAPARSEPAQDDRTVATVTANSDPDPVSPVRSLPTPAPAAAPPPPSAAAPAPPPAPAPLAAIAPVTETGAIKLRARRQNPPSFPARALRAGVTEGRVLARLWITPEGAVEQVDIVSSTPAHWFDDEVRNALSQWRYDPPGQPVDTLVDLNFKP